MFDVGGGELLVILLAVIILFGPKKIPEIARMMGKGVQKMREAQAQFQVQMREINNEFNQPPKPLTDEQIQRAREINAQKALEESAKELQENAEAIDDSLVSVSKDNTKIVESNFEIKAVDEEISKDDDSGINQTPNLPVEKFSSRGKNFAG
ncbi:MAG: Twin-arginine translocase TatA/TatE family subunit [Bacteroidota bacterium]|nr:Twin-arginine translocase TatA/TatE family subunit [Bacteroidota bacterium]